MALVDEYDKPILDALAEPEAALANRDYLRGLYGMVKDCDAHIRFSFLTGVGRFSKANLNNLTDLTLDPDYSAICGYAEADLDAVFAPELPGLDRTEIRRWYNGCRWLGGEKAYNPYCVLLLFRHRRFAPYWFETGTRHSSSGRWQSGASPRWTWTGCRPRRRCCPPSTWAASPRRRCCSRPAT